MARMYSCLILLAAAACSSVALADRAMADIPPGPPPQPRIPSQKLVVKVDPNLETAKLVLPANMNGGPGAPAPAPREAPGADKGAFWSPTRTMIAGLCLSLAVVSLIFVRGTSGGARMLMIAVASVSVLGIGAAAWADLAPFPRPRPQPQPQPVPIAQVTQLASGDVTVEYTGKPGDPITLVLPAKALGGVFRLPPGNVLPPGLRPRNGAIPAPGAPAPALEAPAPPAP